MANMREGGFLISKIQKLSSRIFAKLLREYKAVEITPAQGRVMFPLWNSNKDKLSFHELLKITSLSKATLSHLLDNLEKSGHIKRIPPRGDEDKRTVYIKLTEEDKELQEKYVEVSNQMKDLFYKGFTEEDIDEFEEYLKRLLDNLTDYNEERESQ
ncbi:MAG: MarR family transcriptional regulator [Candidatus Lokiarchaeota archaeon]|nr:MarR family transcriptional regulator [Candidatus Lokiarchaeota archaeon]